MENQIIISPIINGIRYILNNKQDCIQSQLLLGRQCNQEIFKAIKTEIQFKNLDHFLNVGCHIGTLSLPISFFLGKVTAIEAYPPTYKLLCDNIDYNNIRNIETYNIAVGNSTEDVYFMSMDMVCPIENRNRVVNNTGGMHVFTSDDILNGKRSSNLTDQNIVGKMEKLDNLPIDNFDIMLVDIEGCEYEFILGASSKIRKNKPIIIIEIWDDNKRQMENMDRSREDVIRLIFSFGYKLHFVINDDFIFYPI